MQEQFYINKMDTKINGVKGADIVQLVVDKLESELGMTVAQVRLL